MSGRARDYAGKRRFDETPEPSATFSGNVDVARARPGDFFMIHQHHATRLHFDLRLEMFNGDTPVLASWAVPKNLPLTKGKPHLAVHVEDHPFDYGEFSGTIPEGNYGAGEVRIFDTGAYELLEQEPAKLTFRLRGRRFDGEWHMILPEKMATKDEWLVFFRKSHRPAPDPPPELAPMMATLEREAFDDDKWLFEPKWDGVRALAVCEHETMLVSRSHKDMTASYPELHKLHEQLVAHDAVVDGEVVAFDRGRPSFEKLQSRINLQDAQQIERAMKAIPVSYIAFDLLYLDGRSVVGEPLERRRTLLEELVVPSGRIQVSQAVPGEGKALSDAARAQNLEGIVAKRLGSPYRVGKRTREWLKIKVTSDADVVIGGWSPGEGARSSSFGALLAGVYDDEGLRFIGAVGTGFSDRMLSDLVPRLQAHESERCPFIEDPTGLPPSRFGKALRNARWCEPSLVAAVEFRELTAGLRLRAPSFKGLRTDKSPDECTLAALIEAAGVDPR
ncbi:MAG: non-homologous end-joining DNA ligase [Actinomycetota bacterium]